MENQRKYFDVYAKTKATVTFFTWNAMNGELPHISVLTEFAVPQRGKAVILDSEQVDNLIEFLLDWRETHDEVQPSSKKWV